MSKKLKPVPCPFCGVLPKYKEQWELWHRFECFLENTRLIGDDERLVVWNKRRKSGEIPDRVDVLLLELRRTQKAVERHKAKVQQKKENVLEALSKAEEDNQREVMGRRVDKMMSRLGCSTRPYKKRRTACQ